MVEHYCGKVYCIEIPSSHIICVKMKKVTYDGGLGNEHGQKVLVVI